MANLGGFSKQFDTLQYMEAWPPYTEGQRQSFVVIEMSSGLHKCAFKDIL